MHTPEPACGLLAGVTRAAVIDICKKNDIPIVEGHYFKEDLASAQEVFLTSSLMEIMPVCEMEGATFTVENYRIAPRILRRYREIVGHE